MQEEGNLPRLRTFALKSGDNIAWCDGCRRWHHHGEGGGHRVAHCGSGSPYYDLGYVLEIEGPATSEILADSRRKRPRGPS